ncbi:MAG: hypothetical protein ACRDIB_19530, partial [Ardenticatenaceae bacterium]
IRVFDTQSWEKIGELRLDWSLRQIATSQTRNHLLILRWTDNHMHDESYLHVHTSFLAMDSAHPDVAAPLNLNLSEKEELVRFVVAPQTPRH